MKPLPLLPPKPIQADHGLSDFDCGESPLNEWLKKRALNNHASGASRCFVLCDGKMDIIAYYSLSAGAISREDAPGTMRRNTPDPLPIVLLGRLAVDRRFHARGLGRALLRDAMLRAVHVSSDVGFVVLLTHALSEQARRFYLAHGFVESPLRPMTLMMTIATLRSILMESLA